MPTVLATFKLSYWAISRSLTMVFDQKYLSNISRNISWHLGHEGVQHVVPSSGGDQPETFILHAIALFLTSIIIIQQQWKRSRQKSWGEMSLNSIYQDILT